MQFVDVNLAILSKPFGHFIDQKHSQLILKIANRLMDNERRNGWLQPPVKVPVNTLP